MQMSTAEPLLLTALQRIPIVKPGDSVSSLIIDSCKSSDLHLEENDILVVAQKIISKSENRFYKLSDVIPSEEAFSVAEITDKDPHLVQLILDESDHVLRMRPGLIIVQHRLGFVCANAGIDHSNVQGLDSDSVDWVLLLPEDPDESARLIKEEIAEKLGINVGILIIDSHGRAWRNGAVGMTIGLAGVPGVVDLRGETDLFGYQLRTSTISAADELAAAASLMMGQTSEGTPVVHVRGFPYDLRESSLSELIRPIQKDLFR